MNGLLAGGANLERAYLGGANLVGANLGGRRLSFSILAPRGMQKCRMVA
jgi:uncharacterized protein YjbI with pentapeptide repeats